MTLLPFKPKDPEESEPHATGPARCLACGHKWIFVIPAEPPALGDMECPKCGCHRGARAGLSIPNEDRWVCACSNDLFLVTADRVFCPHCSTFQNFGYMNLTTPETLAALVVAHSLTDFPLQGDFLARAKNHKAPIPGVPWFLCLAVHSVISGGAVWLLTGSLGLGILETVLHGWIDFGKNDGLFGEGEKGFWVDQTLHIACKLLWCLP